MAANVSLKTTYTFKKGLKVTALTVYEDRAKLVKGTDYELTCDGKAVGESMPAPSANVGKHTVKVTGIGNYQGSKSFKYTVKPAATTLSKVAPASKAVKVIWKKQSLKMASSRITGYEIQVATNKAFTKNKK